MTDDAPPQIGDFVTAQLVPRGQGSIQGVVVGQSSDLLYLLDESGLWYRAFRKEAAVVPLSRLWGATGNFVREIRDDLCPGWREREQS